MAEAVTIARPYAVAVFRLARGQDAPARWSEMLALDQRLLRAAADCWRSIDGPNVVAARGWSVRSSAVAGDKLDADAA